MSNLPPVVVEFTARGMGGVQQAFRTVEQAALKADRAREQSAKKQTATAEKEAKKQVAVAERAAEKEAAARAKQAEKAAQAQVKSAQKAADAERKIQERAAREREREARREASRQERLRRAMGSLTPAQYKDRQAVLAQMKEAGVQRRIDRFKANPDKGASDMMADKIGEKLNGVATKAGLVMGAFALMSKGVELVTGALSQFAGFIVGDMIERLDRGKKIQQQLNAMGGAGGRRKEVEQWINKTSDKLGVAPEVMQEMFGTAGATYNDPDKAMAIAEHAAKYQKAFGAGGADLAAILAKQVKSNPQMSNDELAAQAAVITARGQQKGSLLGPQQLGAQWDKFNGIMLRMNGNAGANMAHATGLATFAGQAGMDEGEVFMKLDKFIESATDRLNVGNTGPMKRIGDLPSEIARAVKDANGSEEKAKQLGYSGNAIDFLRPFMKAYSEAQGDKGAALDKIIADATGTAGANLNSLDAAGALVDETGAQKLDRIMIKVQKAFEGLLPTVEEKLIPALERITPKIQEWLEDGVEDAIAAFGDMVDSLDWVITTAELIKIGFEGLVATLALLASPIMLLGEAIIKLVSIIPGMKNDPTLRAAQEFGEKHRALIAKPFKSIGEMTGLTDPELSPRQKARADAKAKHAAEKAAKEKAIQDAGLGAAADKLSMAADKLAKTQVPTTPIIARTAVQ